MSQLAFRYEYSDLFDPRHDDPEDAGSLTVSVETGQFSGTGTFHAGPEEVTKFGERLSAFPIAPDRPLEGTWGEGGRTSRVVVCATNATGTLLVSVEIDDDLSHFVRDRRVSEGVRTSFVTDYVQIDAFRRSIANLMDRKVDEAILRGH